MRLLETTNANLDRVAQRVGYEGASSFRRLFVRASGVSPREISTEVWKAKNEIEAPATEHQPWCARGTKKSGWQE
jgi:AraC-like DNA-binding protein